MVKSFLEEYRAGYGKVIAALDLERVGEFIEIVRRARDSDNQIFVFGNGGSATIASHFAVDMSKGASFGQRRRFRIFALTESVAALTAWSNDIGYEVVFREQLCNLARQGDVVIAISANGNSPNVLGAVEYARETGCVTLGMSGLQGGRLAGLVQHSLVIPSNHLGQIEDGAMCVCHLIAYYFMEMNASGEVANPGFGVRESEIGKGVTR